MLTSSALSMVVNATESTSVGVASCMVIAHMTSVLPMQRLLTYIAMLTMSALSKVAISTDSTPVDNAS
jgi:hypothetical protein